MARLMNYRIWVKSAEQLFQALQNDDFEYIYAPLELLGGETADKFRIIAVPDVFLGDCEKRVFEKLLSLKKQGFTRALAHTSGHLQLISDAGMKAHCGFRMNITNTAAIAEYEKLGLCDICASVELTVQQIKQLGHTVPMGIIAYGKLPLMILRRCPVADGKPCGGIKKDCPKAISDRMGNVMRLDCAKNSVEVLNPDRLILSDKTRDLEFLDFAVLKMTDETDVNEIYEMYKNSGKPDGRLTRGLYYRGSI